MLPEAATCSHILMMPLNYLHYMAISRIVKFEIPKYLENLIGIVIDKFNESGISTVDIGTVFM